MRKSYFILSVLMLTGFMLTSVGTLTDKKSCYGKNRSGFGFAVNDTLTWKLLGQIKYIKKGH